MLQSQGSVPSGSKFNKSDIVVAAKPNDPGTKFRKQDKSARYSRKYKNSIEYKNQLKGGISQIMIFLHKMKLLLQTQTLHSKIK